MLPFAVLCLCALGAEAAAGDAIRPLRIDGLVAATFTPYNADGTLKLEAVPDIATWLADTGVKAVFVGGTTGDSVAMTARERMDLLKAWAPEAKAKDLRLIAHVGADALGDVLQMAIHAETLGAAAIGCMPSVFFKPATVKALALWLKEVGRAAPSTPLYYYHIPSMTGVKFNMLDLIQAVEEVGVPQFVGVKYTGLYENRAWMDFEQCRRYRNGFYDVYVGREEMSVQGYSVGARGFIGSQFNFAGDVYNLIAKAWPNTTRALEIQATAQDLITAWSDAVPAGVNGNRMVMQIAVPSLGDARLPNLKPDKATTTKLHGAIRSWCMRSASYLGMVPKLCGGNASFVV